MAVNRLIFISVLLVAALYSSSTVFHVESAQFRLCNNSPFCSRFTLYAEKALNSKSASVEESSAENTFSNDKGLDSTDSSSLPTWAVSGCSSSKSDVDATGDKIVPTWSCLVTRSVDKHQLSLDITVYLPGIVRVTLDDNNPTLGPRNGRRYKIPTGDVIQEEQLKKLQCSGQVVNDNSGNIILKPVCDSFEKIATQSDSPLFFDVSLFEAVKINDTVIRIEPKTFIIEISQDGVIVNRFNAFNGFNWEAYRVKGSSGPCDDQICDATNLNGDSLWNESVFGFQQNIPFGPSSVGVDISFSGTPSFFGLFEHSADFSLSFYDEPYRLYNSDSYGYPLFKPFGLYESIPFLTSLGKDSNDKPFTTGFVWFNPSDTWIKFRAHEDQTSSWWVSETGIVDAFSFVGPTPAHVLRQYYFTTGFPALHPLFAAAKHHSRWGYKTTDDVIDIDEKYNQYGIPYDTMWLDLQYADAARYFVFDPVNYQHPEKLLKRLDEEKRHLVLLVDPHVKVDPNYFVYKDALQQDYFMKNPDGSVFVGNCWPGASSYPDYFRSDVREWFSNYYATTPIFGDFNNLFIWNDMNEPSVFDSLEQTILPDRIMSDKVGENREVHNLYGYYYTETTYKGLLKRNATQRPFILTRAGFSGIHKYAFVWTGDNMASFDELQVTVRMILSASLSGISSIGADVGGFGSNPTAELYTRWHQFGAWYPFYREHSSMNTNPREPWVWDADTLRRVKNAAILRYKLLPYWYTLFAEYALSGTPICRPAWWLDIDQDDVYARQDFYLVGDYFMVKPVDHEMSSYGNDPITQLYLPKKYPGWYRYFTDELVNPGYVWEKFDMENIIVFVAAGSIIPTKEIFRTASTLQADDPYTLHIYLTPGSTLKEQKAEGKIYIDDFNSFEYKNGKFLTGKFSFDGGVLSYTNEKIYLPKFGSYQYGSLDGKNFAVEHIVIHGAAEAAQSAVSVVRGTASQLQHSTNVVSDRKTITIFNPEIYLNETDWSVEVIPKSVSRLSSANTLLKFIKHEF